MNTLEEYLIKEGILEKFLGNTRVFSTGYTTLAGAFLWDNSEEGYLFWANHDIRSDNCIIRFTRIRELIEERIPRFRKEQKC